MMRAKMRVASVDKSYAGQEALIFRAVARNDRYPDDGTDEDNTYAKFSPSGELRLTVANPALHGKFAEGDTFYVDFTPVPAKKDEREKQEIKSSDVGDVKSVL